MLGSHFGSVFRDPLAIKHDAELRWWLEQWDPVLRAGGFFPGDALRFLDDEEVEPTYLGRRWQQARAEVGRVLQEAEIDDARFFEGTVVVDDGPGPLGFPDACPARVSIGVDPLAERFAEYRLLLPNSLALYLSVGAEHIPLVSGSVDVVLARNSLDHVDDPEQTPEEVRRILRPGGKLILVFDIDHTPTPSEPHALTVARVRSSLDGMAVLRERRWDEPFGHDGHRVGLVADKPTRILADLTAAGDPLQFGQLCARFPWLRDWLPLFGQLIRTIGPCRAITVNL